MGQGPSRQKLLVKAEQLRQHDPIVDALRKELLNLIEHHAGHQGSIRKCPACSVPLKAFHDDVAAFRMALDEAARKNHESDHYKMLSEHADHVMAEIKGIIEGEITRELQEKKQAHQPKPPPLAPVKPTRATESSCPTPLARASGHPVQQPSPGYYQSGPQAYESPSRPGADFSGQQHCRPPLSQDDVPVSPGLSDGIFDPEDYLIPVSSSDTLEPSHDNIPVNEQSWTLVSTSGYEPAFPTSSHVRQPSKAGSHPEIRSAHKVTQSLAHELPTGHSVDPKELTTRLGLLPPVSRSGTHRAMPSMADEFSHDQQQTGVDPRKLEDRLSRLPSTTDHHRRASSGNTLKSIDEGIGECDPDASTRTQIGSTMYLRQFNEHLARAPGEHGHKHLHSNPLYAEQTISLPGAGLLPLSDSEQQIGHNLSKASGSAEPTDPRDERLLLAMNAHQVALHQLDYPTIPCSKSTLSRSTKKRAKASKLMSDMFDSNAYIPNDDDDTEDDNDDSNVMGLSTLVAFIKDHMAESEGKMGTDEQSSDTSARPGLTGAPDQQGEDTPKPMIERLGPCVSTGNPYHSHRTTTPAGEYSRGTPHFESKNNPARAEAKSKPFNDTMRADLAQGVSLSDSPEFVSCKPTFQDPTMKEKHGHHSTASVPINKDELELKHQTHQPSWDGAIMPRQVVVQTPLNLRT